MSPLRRRGDRRWFLPHSPDVLGTLREQADVTVAGLDAFARWGTGDAEAAGSVREAEHRADEHRRRLVAEIREAFTTPLEPEDLFDLSRQLDEVINGAKNTVREAEALGVQPDAALREMTELAADGTRRLREALAALGSDPDAANAAAAAAIKRQRDLERVYRTAMARLLESDDLRLVTSHQELYRRLVRVGDHVVAVADRVGYATVKES